MVLLVEAHRQLARRKLADVRLLECPLRNLRATRILFPVLRDEPFQVLHREGAQMNKVVLHLFLDCRLISLGLFGSCLGQKLLNVGKLTLLVILKNLFPIHQ